MPSKKGSKPKQSPSLSTMPSKKGSKPKQSPPVSYQYPQHHSDVVQAVSGAIPRPWFQHRTTTSDVEKATFVMGTFKCNTRDCSNDGWGSKKVSIVIRGYRTNGYNAVVYNQRCKTCKQLGVLALDKDSYIERVAYRLKTWAGAPTEEQTYSESSGLPHKRELCEGCQRGYCQQRSGSWD